MLRFVKPEDSVHCAPAGETWATHSIFVHVIFVYRLRKMQIIVRRRSLSSIRFAPLAPAEDGS
jgi:hypothetical protein